jgi:hypothetical protein
MHAQMTIMRDVIYAAAARGADFKKVCDELQLNPHDLNNSEIQVPFEQAGRLWDVVIKYTKDPLLALHLAEELSPTILGMIGNAKQQNPGGSYSNGV